MDENHVRTQSNTASEGAGVAQEAQMMYNYGNAAMDTQKYSGVDSANASTTMFSPPSDQNNYAASGINHNTNELIQNSLAFNNGLYNQMENLPVVQNSTIAQSSTHSAQQELNRSRNDLPEGDREYGSDMISKESEGHALSEGAAMHHDPQKTEESVSEQNIVTTVEKLPEAATKKRVCDTVRVQKVLEELSAKLSAADQGLGVRHKRQKISDDARSLVVEYAKELSSAILEESCLLAKHRNSKELIAADIKLIFAKKFRLDISGYQPRSTRLTQQAAEREEFEEEEEGNVKGDEEIPVDKVADSAAEAAAPLESESTQDSTAVAADIAVAHSDEFMQRHDEEQDSRSSEVTSHGMILAHDYPRDDYHNLP